jgi:DNA helicase HerA-like ATPase
MSKSAAAPTQDAEAGVLATPASAFSAIAEDAVNAGGAWQPPPGHEGSIARTMFDLPSSEDGTVSILLPPENIDSVPSQALVRIESLADKRTYLGAIVKGPFAEPDGLRADATPIVVTTVQGGVLMPRHHGRAQVALIGERIAEVVIPPRRRPKPNSPVFILDAKETAEVLRIGGNLPLGLADGFDDLVVAVPGESKGVFPRHVGILGTTGGGKSTTVSGLIAKSQATGMAVVIIDTEGEYCAIHEPTKDPRMVEALKRRGLSPKGVPNTHVYHLVGRATANSKHPSVSAFTLQFSQLSPYAVQEILELTDAQGERFFKAYDVAKLALDKFGIWPSTDEQRRQLMELDEQERGYPGMTLAHLLDVVREIHWFLDQDEAEPYLETPELRTRRKELRQIIGAASPPKNVISWRALMGRLGRIKRLGIFDAPRRSPLDYGKMLQPGHVSILDLSDTDSPQLNNLVIAELLRGVQQQQEENYAKAVSAGKEPTPTTIYIEESHEFLSAQRITQMPVLFQQVARIARRGRKRWLGLVFITQLPQHLPDEVLGLINNWVLHKIGDANVVNRLRKSIGGIDESLWRHLSSLAAGQAVVSFTTLARPLQVTIDPTPCRLLMTQ